MSVRDVEDGDVRIGPGGATWTVLWVERHRPAPGQTRGDPAYVRAQSAKGQMRTFHYAQWFGFKEHKP